MTQQLIAALITGATLAMMFSNTRTVGILWTSSLIFFMMKVKIVARNVDYHIYFRKTTMWP